LPDTQAVTATRLRVSDLQGLARQSIGIIVAPDHAAIMIFL
jgi:hypothetical protein